MRRFVLGMLTLLLLQPLAWASTLHVESGYAETLIDTQCFFVSALYDADVWKAGYKSRYPYNDVAVAANLPLKRHWFFAPNLHLNTRFRSACNLDGTVSFGQKFTIPSGAFTVSYAFGVQMSWFLSPRIEDQLFSQSLDYHLFLEYRFWEKRIGLSIAYDSSTFFWYGYYIFNPIVTIGGDWKVTEAADITWSARCRNSDLWVENQNITMVEFKLGCVWRLQ